MKNLNLKGARKLSKSEQKSINGGAARRCGGDGSYIIVNGKKVCCYVPWSGQYRC